MPAQPVTLAWAGGSASLDERGGVLLQTEGATAVRLALVPDPELRPVLVEPDVIEHAGSGDHEVSQRVTAGEHCQLRWVSESAAAEPVRVELDVEVPSGQHAWVWPSGADGLLAVCPEIGPGPVLLVQVTQGSLTWAGESEDEGGRRVRLLLAGLQPGERWVTVLRVRSLPTLAHVEDLLPSWYQPLVLGAGESWEAEVADFGIDAAPTVQVEFDEDDNGGLVQIGAPPGRHRVALHGRRGITELLLEVCPDSYALTQSVAEQVLRSSPARWSSAGAVVVQKAVEYGVVASDRHVEDALDRFDWTSRGEPLAIAFGCRRALLEGERAMAEEAIRQVVALPHRRLQAQVRRAVALAAAALGADIEPLRAAMRPVPEPVLADYLDAGRRTAVGEARLAGAINRLGAGLPGRPVCLDPIAMAELVVLLDACPERWTAASLAATTADEARRRLFAGYAAGDITDPTALAWLLIGG